MEELICPVCGVVNPPEAETCSNCGSSLHAPIQPGEAPTRRNTSELEPILPDWLREAREKARDTDAREITQPLKKVSGPLGGSSDLLAGLNAQSKEDEAEIPDWLANIPLVGARAFEAWQEVAANGPEVLQAKLAPYGRNLMKWFVGEMGSFGVVFIQFVLTVVAAAILYAYGEGGADWALRFGARLGGERGEAVMLRGPSGCGKTTLFRALAGLWPFGHGRIATPPAGSRVLFLPQKPYLPMGTLKDALCYPDPASQAADSACRAPFSDSLRPDTLSRL